jgi:AraC-like DNA-binding protein
MNDFPSSPLPEHEPYDRIHEFYMLQEPMLLAAIMHGDRGEARRLINHVLVHIYSAGEERNDLLKGLLLELVVMISRAAVQAGARQSDVLGMNFRTLTDLAEIDDDGAQAAWLRNTLEHVISIMERRQKFNPPLLIVKALDFMRLNLHKDISRDETARHAGISAGRFSQMLKERTGRTFTELLRQYRVDHASDMLLTTERSIAEIADACGFCDQSYLTHVFQDVKGMTPRQFRDSVKPQASQLNHIPDIELEECDWRKSTNCSPPLFSWS